jgi:redox-sensitive bicupin YhaK (pirin superfamily)
MIRVRRSEERGRFALGWLDTRHTFSFGDYHDPEHMGFRNLRVLNEDVVAPGAGFPAHGHRDMEIVTYLLSGALRHRDSMGNGAVIRPGEIQRMTAGTGVTHSEANASPTEPAHLLQIWILPARRGLAPSYEQKAFPESERYGRFRVLAAPDGREGAIALHADASILGTLLDAGARAEHGLAPGRHAWLQVVRGDAAVEGERLRAGDGAALSDVRVVAIEALAPSEVLLFDLA